MMHKSLLAFINLRGLSAVLHAIAYICELKSNESTDQASKWEWDHMRGQLEELARTTPIQEITQE